MRSTILASALVFGVLTAHARAESVYIPDYGYVNVQPNVFGGYNLYGARGEFAWTQPNVYGGSNYNTSRGQIGWSQPNGFGGSTYMNTVTGFQGWSQPNAMNGENYYGRQGLEAHSSQSGGSWWLVKVGVVVVALGFGVYGGTRSGAFEQIGSPFQ